MAQMDLNTHRKLIKALMDGQVLGFSGQTAELIETHISSVIITPDYVYKFKKPVDLGFLNFSTLKKRRFYCEEEIRLNKRLSADLYIDVISVYGTPESPSIEPVGEVMEYAVRMKPFKQSAQLDRLLMKGELEPSNMLQFADYIAEFHRHASEVNAQDDYGDASQVMKPVIENFEQIQHHCQDKKILSRLGKLKQWSEHFCIEHTDIFIQRKQQGYIRECHGDLHLRNLAWVNNKPLAFDCIEFDPMLYWIDVINDIAFLVMDLFYQQRQDLALVFLNRYLEISGDYAGLKLLRFYMLYRAMVRAKIEAITASQPGVDLTLKRQSERNLEAYIKLAEDIIQADTNALLIMHGPSASGKSTLSKGLVTCFPVIVLRSDIERKRLFGIKTDDHQGDDFKQGIYSPDATDKTYARLSELAELILRAGYSVIVDATFNQSSYREGFLRLSSQLGCSYRVLNLKVSETVLKQRILARVNDISDADINVLQKQLENWPGLSAAEKQFSIDINMNGKLDINKVCEKIFQEIKISRI